MEMLSVVFRVCLLSWGVRRSRLSGGRRGSRVWIHFLVKLPERKATWLGLRSGNEDERLVWLCMVLIILV